MVHQVVLADILETSSSSFEKLKLLRSGFPATPTPRTRDGHDRRNWKTKHEDEDPDKAAHDERKGCMLEWI